MKEKECFIFKEAPDFYRMNDRGEIGKGDGGGDGQRTVEDIEEGYKERQDLEKKREKNKAPSTKELREYKRKLISIHAKDVELNFPSAYPVLGLKDEDEEKSTTSSSSSNDKGGGGNTKKQPTTKKRKRTEDVTRPRSSANKKKK